MDNELLPGVTQESDGCSCVPHWLLTLVKPMSVVVYAQFIAYADTGVVITMKMLASDLGISERTVKKSLNELRDANVFGRKPCNYQLRVVQA